jgi:acyl-CoA synthetase (AMP-forming)/AMP-acid ligase II
MITMTIGDYYDRCVDFFGKETALTYKDQSYTYNEMGEKANRIANAFQKMGKRQP